ncbi:FecCD family ABC transporter permease [Roseibium aggregatum]|uniref:Iron ABC transporter permease n=1 Tax=Roseibium aggregatum TaxID=187304 RepID=A0A939EGC5_9HYPH|nr:iron ABC transporter permease [Roseibium aggregatum]MBN9672216.1 iron ABC transporter permease [Roseibium aggregatum]
MSDTARSQARHPRRSGLSRAGRPMAGLVVLASAVVLTALWAMVVGTSDIGLPDVYRALFEFDGSRDHIVVTTVRLPRILAAILAGASLAVAGALMQAVTNNPLASPGLLGVNAGAAFAVVLALVFLDDLPARGYVWVAFAGAGVAGGLVYAIGSIGFGGATPLKLALAGAVFSAFVSAMTTSILIFDATTIDSIRLWSVGSLANRPMSNVLGVLPYIVTGLAAALLFSRQITTMSLGADVARTVGQNLALWRIVSGAIVALLAGSAVAMAGPIGFVGLVIPHMARMLAGSDYRRVIPVSALGGALLVLLGDNLLRAVFPERTIPVGITMAVLGAPFFVYLARNRLRGNN